MKMPSCSVTWTWLTKSSSLGGRSERSKSSSAPTALASWMTTSVSCSSGSIPGVRIPSPGFTNAPPPQPRARGLHESRRLRPRRTPQGRLHHLLRAGSAGVGEQPLRLRRGVAEVEQPFPGQGTGVLLAWCERRAVGIALDLPRNLLAQLDDDPLSGPLADPRHRLEPLGVTRGDRSEQFAHGSAR